MKHDELKHRGTPCMPPNAWAPHAWVMRGTPCMGLCMVPHAWGDAWPPCIGLHAWVPHAWGDAWYPMHEVMCGTPCMGWCVVPHAWGDAWHPCMGLCMVPHAWGDAWPPCIGLHAWVPHAWGDAWYPMHEVMCGTPCMGWCVVPHAWGDAWHPCMGSHAWSDACYPMHGVIRGTQCIGRCVVPHAWGDHVQVIFLTRLFLGSPPFTSFRDLIEFFSRRARESGDSVMHTVFVCAHLSKLQEHPTCLQYRGLAAEAWLAQSPIAHPSLWPSGVGSRLGRNRLWVRFLAVSDIYPMFIEPTITWVSGYIWLDTKIVLKKQKHPDLSWAQKNGLS